MLRRHLGPLDDDPEALSRKILRMGHAAYPVCRDSSRKFLGVARAPDLVSALLDKGCIDRTVLETQPLSVREDSSVLKIIEQLRAAAVPLAIVKDSSGRITGGREPDQSTEDLFFCLQLSTLDRLEVPPWAQRPGATMASNRTPRCEK